MSKPLAELQQMQADFDRAHEGAVPFFEEVTGHEVQALEHLVVCITGEVGELANEVKKIRRGDASYEARRAALESEVADIFAYVMKLANQMSFDLEISYERKMTENSSKFRRYERK
jgi:NTP pyrophosphatase (non-canonical NTP hydrolase)